MMFKECYALEKIHGTSANITWKDGEIHFFSGGEKHEKFIKLFDEKKLISLFKENIGEKATIINGEAYGGKQQGMSGTYGKDLKFVVFDVRIDGTWLDVVNAEGLTKSLGLEFVDFRKISTDIKELDKERDLPSVQAKRNGIEEEKQREGIVLRPLTEVNKSNGNRIIAKHKGEGFNETALKRIVDGSRLKVIEDAKGIANEWVTEMRLTHVLDNLKNPTELKDIPIVIKAMVEDVFREGKDELVESKEAKKAIGSRTVQLYKDRIKLI